MKKLKLLSLLLLSVIFVNCEKEEQKTYDGKALLTFPSKTASVGVLLGAVSSDFEVIFGTLVEAPGAVVTLAPMPLLAGDTAVPAVLGVDYTIATSTITLGGGLRHKFVVKFLESGATLAGKKVMFRISSPTIPVAIFNENVAITARLLCPVEATQFVGNYRIVETSPLVDGPTLSSGTIVAVSVIAGSPGGGGRTFRTAHYPTYCPGLMSFNFDLSCGRIVVRPNLGGLCNCSGPNVMGPATVSTTYVAGATDFTLRFTNDVGNTCGPAVQTTYSFTKQ
jgi:hypothetical protein